MSFLLVPLLTLMVMALCLASSLSTLSLVPQAYSLGFHLISIDSCLLCHKVPFDKRALRHRNVPCVRSHHKLVAQQGLESDSPNSSPALLPTDHKTSVIGETSAPEHQDRESKQFICMSA